MTREEAEKKVCKNIKKNIQSFSGIDMTTITFEDAKARIIKVLGKDFFDRVVEREMAGTNNLFSAIKDFIKISEEMENKDDLHRSVDRKFEA